MKEKKELIRYGAVCAAVLYLLVHYWDLAAVFLGRFIHVIHPLLFGCAAAYLLNLIMSFYERTILKGWKSRVSAKRAVSILMSVLTLLAALALIVCTILPELKACIEILISSIPAAWRQVTDFLNDHPEFFAMLPKMSDIPFDFQQILNQLLSWLSSGAGASVFGYLTSVVSVIFSLFVAFIFAIYLLAGKEWLARQLNRLADTYLPWKSFKGKFLYVLRTLDESFHHFIVGQCTEAVILGILCILGMLVLRLPYAVMIGVLIGATALIPIFGAYIGGAVGVIMIFTVSPLQSLLFLVFLVILQQLENQLIYPRVVGTSIGLPGILVFSAVMVGGSLFGVAGVLLGIPLTAACYQLLKNDLQKREPHAKNSTG